MEWARARTQLLPRHPPAALGLTSARRATRSDPPVLLPESDNWRVARLPAPAPAATSRARLNQDGPRPCLRPCLQARPRRRVTRLPCTLDIPRDWPSSP